MQMMQRNSNSTVVVIPDSNTSTQHHVLIGSASSGVLAVPTMATTPTGAGVPVVVSSVGVGHSVTSSHNGSTVGLMDGVGVTTTISTSLSGGLVSVLRRHFLLWRLPEWIALIVLFIVPLIIGSVVSPFCKKFELSDHSINFPFTEKEMFPNWSLAPVIVGPIFVVYLPCILFWRATSVLKWRELNCWTIYHLTATALTFAFINTTKVMAGRLRPDFVARLRKEGLVADDLSTLVNGIQYPPRFNPGFSYANVCETKYLQDNSVLRDGHLSFPSGHSGTGFSAMIPVCLFLISRLRPFHHQSLWRLIVSFLPIILSWVIALSRVQDYRHNYSDILGGAVIGVISSLAVFPMYFRYFSGPWLGIWAMKMPLEEEVSLVEAGGACSPYYTSTCVGGVDGGRNPVVARSTFRPLPPSVFATTTAAAEGSSLSEARKDGSPSSIELRSGGGAPQPITVTRGDERQQFATGAQAPMLLFMGTEDARVGALTDNSGGNAVAVNANTAIVGSGVPYPQPLYTPSSSPSTLALYSTTYSRSPFVYGDGGSGFGVDVASLRRL